jgi:hypothetical protein
MLPVFILLTAEIATCTVPPNMTPSFTLEMNYRCSFSIYLHIFYLKNACLMHLEDQESSRYQTYMIRHC